MTDDIVIQSNLLRLRRTEEDDLDFVLNAEQDEENRSFVNQWSHSQHREALSNKDVAHLMCETADHGRSVGYLILAGLESANQCLEFRRLVITQKGHGYGREAIKLVKKLAFEKWNLHRLWLDVKTQNRRARSLYESEGLVDEGVLRECLKAEAGFESLAVMSMLRQEY